MARDGQVRFEVEGEYAVPYKGIDSAAVWVAYGSSVVCGVLLSPGGAVGGNLWDEPSGRALESLMTT